MVSMLASSAVDCGFKSLSNQTIKLAFSAFLFSTQD